MLKGSTEREEYFQKFCFAQEAREQIMILTKMSELLKIHQRLE
jgi:hypothetical protein